MGARRFFSILHNPTVIAIAILALAGCGSPSDPSAGAVTQSAAGISHESGPPSFDGPYAAEFADFYSRATSDFVREVLWDGQITDAEFAEMTDRFSSCLADQGITFLGFNPDGGLRTSVAQNGGDTHAIVSDCSRSSGEDFIGALHSMLVTNPDDRDWSTIVAECLVKKGVVPSDYSAADFAQDEAKFADFESVTPELRDALLACTSDPLGLAN